MAFDAVTANTPSDLLDKWYTFLVTTTGLFTRNEHYTSGATYDRMTFSRGGKYYNCYASKAGGDDKWFGITLSTGHTSGVDIGNQPDESDAAWANFESTLYSTVHFYSYSDSVYAAIEYTSGKFRHFGMGEAIQIGSYVGGEFAAAVYWGQSPSEIDNPHNSAHNLLFGGRSTSSSKPSIIRADVTATPQWRYLNDSSPSANYGLGPWGNFSIGNTLDGGAYEDGKTVSNFNGRTILMPVYLLAHDEDSSFYPVALIDNVRLLNMENYSPKESMFLGSDEWVVYPIAQKNGATGDENSAGYAVAYKKVT